jgi:catechol-2,3-dioxygenase
MPPELNGIDHIHLYVSDREEAAQWYKDVLGFTIIESLNLWAKDESGPLTIEDPAGKIHLALFKKDHLTPSTAIAFNAKGKEFIEWKDYLEERGISVRCADHSIAWSLYFKDLCGNSHEITTYQYDYVSSRIQ